MRIAFMGTPPFAAVSLKALHAAGHEIAAVYTQPQKPRGRGQSVRPSAVQAAADTLGLPVRTPASMRDPAEAEALADLNVDAAVVVAYGQILPPAVLEAPRLGSFNLHGSLLPRWRGAAPIQRAILAGDTETGVQVMRMSEGLDEGAVLLTARTPIDADDTFGSVHDRLAQLGAELIVEALDLLSRGEALEVPQAAEGLTDAKKIKPEEARIDWSRSAIEIDRLIRGLSPAPGAWFEVETPKGRLRVKPLLSRLSQGQGEPGELIDDALQVACGSGALRLLTLQREGGRAQAADEFLRGLPLPAGARLL
ncbi:methionyl-tRNA formyltransferase [soil metagenome]